MFVVFGVVVLIQILYYAGLFSFFSFAKEPEKTKNNWPVSVIISCKNEADNLRQNLPYFVQQQYQNYELILVDDASTDQTHQVMLSFQKKHDSIRVIKIPLTTTYSGNKKNALTQAIAFAQHEHLLFTDADCMPRSESWITDMQAAFVEKKQMVLGYGAYKKEKSVLNKLIRYETLLTAWQYFSYARIGLPYMGVGRNMAYTKTLFKQADGFSKHQNIRSGDDDLLVNQVGTSANIAYSWTDTSHTLSDAKASWSSWIHQKRRHITTATAYKPIHQLLLGLFFISQFFFFILSILLIWHAFNTPQVLMLIGVRYLFYYLSLIPAANKLKETDLIRWAPVLEIFLMLIQIRIFVSNLWKKPKSW